MAEQNKKEGLVPEALTKIANNLDQSVLAVIGSDGMQGFSRAYMVAAAADTIQKQLTDEYMKPIMALQGHKLGFKTDKDTNKDGGKGPGYPIDVVRSCLIEAVLTGVEPTGNHFNIIASNCYLTKEGFGFLLKKIEGLTHELIFDLPRINPEKTSAAVKVKIRWKIGHGGWEEREMEFPIKMNAYMGTDAVIGKGTRKARAWLFNTLMNTEIADGDIMDVSHVELNKKEEQEMYDEKLRRKAEEENLKKNGEATKE